MARLPRPVRGHQPVNTGPDASSTRDGEPHDIAEFFVMRKYFRWWQRLIASLIFPVPTLLISLLWVPFMAVYLYFKRFPLH